MSDPDQPSIRPISESEREAAKQFFRAHPLVSEVLPRTLPCGFYLTEFHVECSKCCKNIDMDWSYVNIKTHDFGSKIVEVWEAQGVCRGCKTLTGSYLRFHSDGHYDTLVGKRWRAGRTSKPEHLTNPPWSYVFKRVVKVLLRKFFR